MKSGEKWGKVVKSGEKVGKSREKWGKVRKVGKPCFFLNFGTKWPPAAILDVRK